MNLEGYFFLFALQQTFTYIQLQANLKQPIMPMAICMYIQICKDLYACKKPKSKSKCITKTNGKKHTYFGHIFFMHANTIHMYVCMSEHL